MNLLQFEDYTQEQYADAVRKTFPEQISFLENGSTLQKVRPHGVTEADIVALGRMLVSAKKLEKMTEEAGGSVADLGSYPRVALNALTFAFSNSPLSAIASTQPIDHHQGYVYFEDWEAATDRGNVTAGQKLMSTLGKPDVSPNGNFTGLERRNYLFLDVNSDADDSYEDVALGGDELYNTPLDPQKVFISGQFTVDVGGAQTVTLPSLQADPQTGFFSYVKYISSTPVGITGTVNFEEGTATFAFIETPDTIDLKASFQTMADVTADVPRAQLKIQTKQVNAHFKFLKTLIGFQESYEASKRLGINVEQKSTMNLATTLNNELFNQALLLMLNTIPANTKVTFMKSSYYAQQLKYYTRGSRLRCSLSVPETFE